MRANILVTVPIEHLETTRSILESAGDVIYRKYPSREELLTDLPGVHALYPNARTLLILPCLSKPASWLSSPRRRSAPITSIWRIAKAAVFPVYSLSTEHELMRSVSSTAEHTFGLMLSIMRKLPWAFRSVLEGKWSAAEFRGRDLQGKTIGIVGFGIIGSQLGVFARAFGMTVLVCDPYAKDLPHWVRAVDRDTLLHESHVISLHTPLTSETQNMVNKEWFDRMQGR